MADPNSGRTPRSDLPDNPQQHAQPQYEPPRKFLGMPVWAAAFGLAALAAVMYLVMLTLV
jgi:hypothetical protein